MRVAFVPYFLSLCLAFAVTTPAYAADKETSLGQEVQLPFELLKFESSEAIVKKVQKFAELPLSGNLKPRGQVVQIAYRLAPGNAPLEVIENYKKSYADQGFTVLKDSSPIARAESAGDDRDLLLKRAEGDSESYLFVQSFTVKSSWKAGATREYFGSLVKLNAGEVIVLVQLVAPKAITGRMVKEDVSYILKQLQSQGKVSLYGIYFDVDKTDLKPESDVVLTEIGKALNEDSALRVNIVGHTDNTGSQAHNQNLSQGRAQAVVAALVSRGVAASRLTSEGKGDSQPVANNDSEEGRAKNRRVELVKVS
ncbi:MAG: OmpA family protein [Deltaproteobacteria bacterium]|nr:OmpA family protein [Deltaproteobacteria bacterium]